MNILNCKWEPQAGTSTSVWSVLVSAGGECCVLPQRPWSALCCSCVCRHIYMCVCLCETHWPQIPHTFLCVVYYPPAFWGKAFLVPKKKNCSIQAPQLFIYSVGVWWRSHAVSPNNRLSFWRRRHRGREQQPESIPLKHCLLPGRSQDRIRAQGHTLPCTHVHVHTHIKTLCFLYSDELPCFVLDASFSCYIINLKL